MSAITVDGDLVHYEVLGRGRAVVLIHGWIGSWRYWIPLMQQLHLKYRVYALDLFGYGDSAKNAQKYTIDQQVNLLVEFMDQLGLKKAAMIGHGLGAQVLTEFAQRNYDMIARMLISNAPLFDPGDLGTRVPPGQRVLLTTRDFNAERAIHSIQPATPSSGGHFRRGKAKYSAAGRAVGTGLMHRVGRFWGDQCERRRQRSLSSILAMSGTSRKLLTSRKNVSASSIGKWRTLGSGKGSSRSSFSAVR